MGTSRRYAAKTDRQMDQRILQRVAEENPLQSLIEDDRQAAILPVTRDPQPKPCSAWVRFGPHSMRVDAVVVVWNDVACGIQFTIGERVALLGLGERRQCTSLSLTAETGELTHAR